MNRDLEALDQLIDEAVNEEKGLAVRADELAIKDKEFAEYLAAKKHNDEKLETLWMLVKEYMVNNGINEHENDYIKLKITPSGKYRATESIDFVDPELCDIKKTLNNRKVKAYVEVKGHLPQGVESTGYILRKTLKS